MPFEYVTTVLLAANELPYGGKFVPCKVTACPPKVLASVEPSPVIVFNAGAAYPVNSDVNSDV